MSLDLKFVNILKTFNCAYEKFNKDITFHGQEVAYLASQICNQLLLDEDTKKNLILAGYLHDIAAPKTNSTTKEMSFDVSANNRHCIYGYIFFKEFIPSSKFSTYILYHHEDYNSNNVINNISIPLESNIIKLADDISLLKMLNKTITPKLIIESLLKNKDVYNPIYLNALINAHYKNKILDNLINGSFKEELWNDFNKIALTSITTIEFIEFVAFALDLKCDITNIHSLGVCMCSDLLCQEFNLTEKEIAETHIGSLLHDIGKIGIPDEILKKPSSLTPDEFNIMKKHVEYTYEILSYLDNDEILNIASNHHEKLNGKGYPRCISNLSLCERIVAVADIFIALNQKRSYKDSFTKEKTIEILLKSVSLGEIDGEIVDKIIQNYDFYVSRNFELSLIYNNKVQNLQRKYKLLINS